MLSAWYNCINVQYIENKKKNRKLIREEFFKRKNTCINV